MKTGVVTFLLIVCCLLPCERAQAHSIHVFAHVENGIVQGEGYLSGGKKVVNGEIQVQNKESGAPLFSTRTDQRGVFSFSISELGIAQPVTLLIVLNGGPGHRSEWEISADHYTIRPPEAGDGESSNTHTSSSPDTPPPATPPLLRILAGIGCILGIGAVTAFIKSRKRGSS